MNPDVECFLKQQEIEFAKKNNGQLVERCSGSIKHGISKSKVGESCYERGRNHPDELEERWPLKAELEEVKEKVAEIEKVVKKEENMSHTNGRNLYGNFKYHEEFYHIWSETGGDVC